MAAVDGVISKQVFQRGASDGVLGGLFMALVILSLPVG